MKRLMFPVLAAVLLLSGAVFAQDSVLRRPTKENSPEQAPSIATMTPEMWLYTQELQRHDDPAMAVRRNAEARGDERRNRMMARKWFGLSNARPTAGTTPMMGTYSPSWHGNSWNEFNWVGNGYPEFTVLPVEGVRR